MTPAEMPHFDYTIRLGDILSVGGFIVMTTIAIMSIKGTLRLFGYRLDVLDATVEDLKREHGGSKLQDAEITRLKEDGVQLRQDVSLMRRELFDLSRGRGFVTPETDGLYTRRGKMEGL